MSRLLVAAALIVLTCTAHAGGNPDIRIYIDFGPPNYVHEITPELYTQFDAYVCLDQVGEGVRCASFRLTDLVADYPEVVATGHWTILMSGDLPICYDPWMLPGTTLCSYECYTSDEEPVLAGFATYFYLGGGSCCLQVLDNLDYPRWIVDCSEPGEVDHYCVLANGSINGGECPDGDCSPVPVHGETWGTIKSLYR